MHAYPSVADDEPHDFINVECNGKWYRTSPELAGQALSFIDSARKLLERGVSVRIFGEGILPDAWRIREKSGRVPPFRGWATTCDEYLDIEAMMC